MYNFIVLLKSKVTFNIRENYCHIHEMIGYKKMIVVDIFSKNIIQRYITGFSCVNRFRISGSFPYFNTMCCVTIYG